jgi:hypothetical protein
MPAAATKTVVRVLVIPLEPDNEPYAIIPLHGKYGQGKVAKVSLQDATWARRYRWYATPEFYVVRYITLPGKRGFKMPRMHRDILDAPDGVVVDHIFHDRLDNRRGKIRLATHAQNSQNIVRQYERAKGKYVGTRASWSKWSATVNVNGVKVNLGTYETEKEAALVYDACVRYHYGPLALCNFEGDEAYSVEEARRRAKSKKLARKSSRYRGVKWFQHGGKWHVDISHNGIRHSLGDYDDEIEAAKAYDACARYFFGGSAQTNFPKGETLSPRALYRRNLHSSFERGERTSIYEGVYLKGGRWTCSLKFDNKQKQIGYFASELEAAQAYDACARYYLPAGSFTNFEGTEARDVQFYKRRKTRKGTSKFIGVKWEKRQEKWVGTLSVDGTRKRLGSFALEEDAARAYDDARAAHGLPRVNFPDELQAA